MQKNSKIIIAAISIATLAMLCICMISMTVWFVSSGDSDSSEEQYSSTSSSSDDLVEVVESEKITIELEDFGDLSFILPAGWEYESIQADGTYSIRLNNEQEDIVSVSVVTPFETLFITDRDLYEIVDNNIYDYLDTSVEGSYDILTYQGNSTYGYYTSPLTDASLVGVDPLPDGEYRYIYSGVLNVTTDLLEEGPAVHVSMTGLTNDLEYVDTLNGIYESFTLEVE